MCAEGKATMSFLKRGACLSAALLVLGAGAASPLSLLRPGEPRFKFNKLVAPEKVEQGDEFKIVAFVTPLQNIWDDERVFFHLLTPDAVMKEYPAQGWQQKGIIVNANAASQINSQRWIVGEDVQLGPETIEIPRGLAPGTYLIQMGLFYIADSAKEKYMREPYANKDIKDWIVGSVEITAPKQVRDGGRVELMLSDFETLEDIKKWESGRSGEIGLVGVDEALDGQYSGCLAFPASAYLPIAMLQSFFESAPPEYTDWEQYDYLEFLFRGEFAPGAYDASHISIQIKDVGGSRFQRPLGELEKVKFENVDRAEVQAGAAGAATNGEKRARPRGNRRNGNDGAARAVSEGDSSPARKPMTGPQQTSNVGTPGNGDEKGAPANGGPRGTVYCIRVPVADIASRIDIGNVSHLGFWAQGLPENEEWYLTGIIDDIKLVAEKGKKPDWSEPFVVFENLECPATASPGTAIKMGASFTIARKFRQDYSLYIHIIREEAPHFAMHLERNSFRSTSTWEVGRMHTEGPIYVPVPQDAPPGNYFVNVGLFKTRDELTGSTRYVNTYKWSDGVYTEEQPTLPTDYIKQPYLNRDSKQQWTVGKITIVPARKGKTAPEAVDEMKEMESLIKNTEADILAKPAPNEFKTQFGAPAVKRLDRNGTAGQGTKGD